MQKGILNYISILKLVYKYNLGLSFISNITNSDECKRLIHPAQTFYYVCVLKKDLNL